MLDLAIIGGGPAGLTAGLYATRGGLKEVVMFEMGMPGGQITQSSEIENYPGQLEVVSGMDLMQNWPQQAMRFGLKHEMDEVTRVSRKEDGTFTLTTGSGKSWDAYSVLVGTGSVPKKANFPGEAEFFGRGISTCATCDGFFYRGKSVAVLGGGDTALEEALYLAEICEKVYLIHRRDQFRGSPAVVERIHKEPKIELVLNATPKEVVGDQMGVNAITVSLKDGTERTIEVPGVFVFVGRDVKNDVLRQEGDRFLCDVAEGGEVIVDLNMRTSVPGLYAAGDVRINAAKQVVCAAGDGATAAVGIIPYVGEKKAEMGV